MKLLALIHILSLTFITNFYDVEIIPKHEIFKSNDGELNYRILYPKNFDDLKKYPIHIFLHGIGERGDDNELQLTYVDKVFLNQKNYENYPAIIVFPQAPLNDSWSSRNLSDNKIRQSFSENSSPTNSLSLVIKLMDSLVNESHVNNKRVYLSGLSNGGMGSFELLKNRPNMFASAVIICGGGNPLWAKEFAKSTPVWIAHGSDDIDVHPSLSLNMADAIVKYGGSPKLTLFENVAHDSWNNIFEDPEYLEWIYSYSKN